VALAAAVACLGLTGGAAYAAVHSTEDSARQAVLNDAAKRLGVTPSALSNALQQAQIDQINKLVAEGNLTKAQGQAIIAHIKSGHAGPPAFGFGFGFRAHNHAFHVHGFRVGVPPVFGAPFGRGDMFQAAAAYLGVSQKALFTDLRNGKTLAQVARDQGKSVSGLEDAMVASVQKHVDAAVKAGKLTSKQGQAFVSHVRTMVDDLVNGTFGHHHWGDGGGGTSGPGPIVPQFSVPPPS
jgi:polyhydroxyalkanoate synthesis regulator phasin